MNKGRQIVTLLAAAAIGVATAGFSGIVSKADTQQINVDTTTAVRQSTTHVASGGLYAMSDGNTPSTDLLSGLNRKYLRSSSGWPTKSQWFATSW